MAGELERRWNERLVTVRAEAQLAALVDDVRSVERRRAGKAHIRRLVGHLGTKPRRSRSKRIIRTVIREIVVRVEDERLHAMIHWHGGGVSPPPPPGAGAAGGIPRSETETETAALIITLVR